MRFNQLLTEERPEEPKPPRDELPPAVPIDRPEPEAREAEKFPWELPQLRPAR